MPDTTIQLPLAFDLTATFVSAVAGALAAVRRQYDFIGVFTLAFVTGLGGALIRDGIYLNSGPPAAVRDSRYLIAVLAATLLGIGIDRLNTPLARVMLFFDAIGLGVYAVVGADRALAASLSHLGAILVGVTNAVGGALLRDVLMREEPVLFKPGQLFAMAAAIAATLYVSSREWMGLDSLLAAMLAAGLGIVIRLLAVRYDWKTRPLYWRSWHEHGGSVG
ncbi:MAG TPA: TRIC cation channel family protein [Gemmata sp.]|jgi:uncharacterized membrane protein YeiH|nr:TRIC cation channel family protein [Gemmata sp.]